MLLKSSVILGLLLSVATSSHAQLITDATRATAARDTLFQQAHLLHQEAEQLASTFKPKIKRAGRRHVTRGYASKMAAADPTVSRSKSANVVTVWRQTTIHRRNGAVEERYELRKNGQVALRERHLNGALTYLRVYPHPRVVLSGTIYPNHAGIYLAEGFLQLDQDRYLLPAATR